MLTDRARPSALTAKTHRSTVRPFALLALVPATITAGCAPVASDAPAPMAMRVRVPQITLDRLDAQLHLRVFEKTGDLDCNTATGRVTGTNAYETIAGRNVPPNERCDATRWAQLRMTAGEASPVDTCFDKSMPMQPQRVPGGKRYIVLVEGSGTTPTAGGGTRTRTLGSGCAVVNTMPGATVSVAIEMQEIADVGVCGDMVVSADEVCDEGMATPTCNARCRIPEITASGTMGPKGRPSLAWSMSNNMVVGFAMADNASDPMLRLLSPTGELITSPAINARDNPLDAMSPSEQSNVRVAASPTGYAAVWQTLESTAYNINGFGTNNFDAPVAQQMLVNPTTMPGVQGMVNPAVAIGGTRVVFVWEDSDARVIRTSNTTLAATPAAPMADTPLVTAAMPGGSNGAAPVIAALADGTFVVAWVGGGVGAKDIYAVKLSAAGVAMGTPITVNTQTGNDQDQPAIATNGSDVVIAWRDASLGDPMDMSGSAVRFRHFNGSLTPSGMDHLAPTTVEGDQSNPTVAMAPTGTYFVGWQHAGGTIRGRLFRADGALVVNRFNASTADFEANASADEMGPAGGNRQFPSAAFGGAGRFAVGWLDGASNDIRVRVFIE
jgi:hypothetical protein